MINDVWFVLLLFVNSIKFGCLLFVGGWMFWLYSNFKSGVILFLFLDNIFRVLVMFVVINKWVFLFKISFLSVLFCICLYIILL